MGWENDFLELLQVVVSWENLNSQKRQADEELGALRERNREDLEEIDRLNVANE